MEKNIKKVSKFTKDSIDVYYYQVGTRTFSLSTPSRMDVAQVKNLLQELAQRLDEAVVSETNIDYALRLLNNRTEMYVQVPVEMEEEATTEEEGAE